MRSTAGRTTATEIPGRNLRGASARECCGRRVDRPRRLGYGCPGSSSPGRLSSGEARAFHAMSDRGRCPLPAVGLAQGGRAAMFLRNYWYVAAWSEEVGRKPLQRWLLNEPLAMWRRRDGTPAALADRCPHRGAPLSNGRIVGDDIECGYHGLSFCGDGGCTAVPGAGTLPAGLSTRAYPVVERWGRIFIWMGDPALADEAKIPDYHWKDDPGWAGRGRDPAGRGQLRAGARQSPRPVPRPLRAPEHAGDRRGGRCAGQDRIRRRAPARDPRHARHRALALLQAAVRLQRQGQPPPAGRVHAGGQYRHQRPGQFDRKSGPRVRKPCAQRHDAGNRSLDALFLVAAARHRNSRTRR